MDLNICLLQNETTHNTDFIQTKTIVTLSKLVTAHAIHQCLKFIYSGTIDSDGSIFKVFSLFLCVLFVFRSICILIHIHISFFAIYNVIPRIHINQKSSFVRNFVLDFAYNSWLKWMKSIHVAWMHRICYSV